MGISFSDHLTGMYACYGILGALVNRMSTGEGQHVETSLLRASVSFVSENAARYFETGHVPRRKHRTTTAGVFAEDQDGLAFVLHMSSPDKFWLGLFDVVGKPEWAQDARFNNRKGRIENYDALVEQLQPIFAAGAGMNGCVVCSKRTFPPHRSTHLTKSSPIRKSANTGFRSKSSIPRWVR